MLAKSAATSSSDSGLNLRDGQSLERQLLNDGPTFRLGEAGAVLVLGEGSVGFLV